MTQDSMGNWAEKAKNAVQNDAVKVVRREQTKSKGNTIMEIAEKIRPFLMNLFQGVRDDQGMLYQPSHVRGFALNIAQDVLRMYEEDSKK